MIKLHRRAHRHEQDFWSGNPRQQAGARGYGIRARYRERTLVPPLDPRLLLGRLGREKKDLWFDPELLYVAAMFHDIGLTTAYRESQLRFEVDGATAARDFLQAHGISESDVWNAIALHTTPGIPEHMHPEIFLVQSGAGMDVVGRGFDGFSESERQSVVSAYPRGADFKNGIIDAFYEGMKHRPQSTFGTFKMTSSHSRILRSGAPISVA